MNLEKQKRFLVQAAFYGTIAALVYVVLKFLLPTLIPFLLAFLIVWLLRKPAKWISGKLHLPMKYVSLFFLLLFYVLLFGGVSLLGVEVVTLIKSAAPKLPTFYRQELVPALKAIYHFAEQTLQRFDPAIVSALSSTLTELSASIEQGLVTFSRPVVSWASSAAMGVPGFIIGVVLMITSSFFLANDYDRVMNFLYKSLPEKGKDRLREIWHKLAGSLWIYIRSYTLFLIITFTELNIGLHLLKIPYATVIAGAIAIFDLLPILGTGGIMIPWVVISLVLGHTAHGIKLAVIYAIVTVVRNYVEPKIVGAQLGLHPIISLVSMFVGLQLFGIWGLFGFPVGISYLWKQRMEKQAKKEV